MNNLILTLLNLCLVLSVSAQSVDSFFENQATSDFDKLYLSTDREFYFIGDTLWFSPYIMDARSQYLSTDNCNLYVDLINDKGEIIEEKNFLLNDGFCSGYLVLNNEILHAGNYLLRAYTDRLKTLGNDYFFEKTINLNRVHAPSNQQDSIDGDNKKIILEFYPEGGFLLEGAANLMAFVAHDQNGKRVHFAGQLQGPNDTHISIKTDFNGAGSFFLIPNSKQAYTIIDENNKKLQYRMPEIRKQGAKLRILEATNNAVKLSITASNEMQTGNYYIAVFHRGVGLTYFKFDKNQIALPITLKTSYLGVGINRLVLLNDHFEPLSERLVFINKEGDDLLVDAKTDKKEYDTREQVNINLSIPKLTENEVWARVSVAVVDEKMTGVHGNLQNIKSYLLLDSEIKGQIQTAGIYFIDDSISSSRKLDLLMLTNGWRNYVWTDMAEKRNIELPTAPYGFVFDGNVKKTMSNNPFVGTNVLLNCNNKDFQKVEISKTNENGYFRFDSIFFTDSASIVLQGKNNNNKNYTELEVNTLGMQHAAVGDLEYGNIDDIGTLSFESYKQKYMNEQALLEFFPDRKSILIEEVEVTAVKVEEKQDNHFRMYTPSVSKKLTDNARNSSRNVFEYLNGAGRVAGVRAGIDDKNNSVVIIRGEKASFLLDGFPVESEEILNVPMCDVDVVDIIRGSDASIFGMKGSGGVISVFTRDAGDYGTENEYIPGTIVEKIKGFEKFRSFYNPAYDTDNIKSVIPDYRQTIYWNPAIFIKGTAQSLSFFTCDNLSNYKILIEGITNSGRICQGEAELVVNKRK